jgi:hypothetical protein
LLNLGVWICPWLSFVYGDIKKLKSKPSGISWFATPVIAMYLGFAFNGITLNQIVKTALVFVGLLS